MATKTAAKAPAKKAAAKAPAKKAAAKAPAEKTPKAPALPTYREANGFVQALKSVRALAKENEEMVKALQLVTHLSWKTPGSKVSWTDSTTKAVTEYAEDVLVLEGTELPVAMSTALGLAEKAAADKGQRDGMAVLVKIVKAHA